MFNFIIKNIFNFIYAFIYLFIYRFWEMVYNSSKLFYYTDQEEES